LEQKVYIGCAKCDIGFVLMIDERDGKMRLVDMKWAIKMDFIVCKVLTDRNRVEILHCTINYEVVE
jgi:hypothetical protein